MARLLVENGYVNVRLRLIEQVASLCRGVSVPLNSIEVVEVLRRPIPGVLTQLRGPGLDGLWSGVATIGAWRMRDGSGRAFVGVYGNRDAVSIRLAHSKWRWIVVGHRDAETAARELRTLL